MKPNSTVVSEREDVFTVLADHARSRSVGALWTTAIGGVVNGGLVWWQYPAWSWLAAGFVAAAAFGAWGLVDRVVLARAALQGEARPSNALPELRDLIAVLGTGAAGWAVLMFIAAALGRGARY